VVARSVLAGHLEARHRVLTLLVQGPGVATEAAVKLNHLVRRVERWADLLLGYLGNLGAVGEFAVDPDRAATSPTPGDARRARRGCGPGR